jgi:hypothetical protein
VLVSLQSLRTKFMRYFLIRAICCCGWIIRVISLTWTMAISFVHNVIIHASGEKGSSFDTAQDFGPSRIPQKKCIHLRNAHKSDEARLSDKFEDASFGQRGVSHPRSSSRRVRQHQDKRQVRWMGETKDLAFPIKPCLQCNDSGRWKASGACALRMKHNINQLPFYRRTGYERACRTI